MIADQTDRIRPVTTVHPDDTLRLAGSVVSIGSFDGQYRGQQA